MNIDSSCSLEEFIVSREYAAAAASVAANASSAAAAAHILLKTPPTQEMCIMIQAGQESSFDEFLKNYLPAKTLDAFKNRPLEEKVALTYSIVSYYNQLAAGIQQPPPSHLNFLRLDKAPPLVTSQPQQPPPSTGDHILDKLNQPATATPQPPSSVGPPGVRRQLPNITTFNSNSILEGAQQGGNNVQASPTPNAATVALLHRTQNNDLNRPRLDDSNPRLICAPPPQPSSQLGGMQSSPSSGTTDQLVPPTQTPSARDQDNNSPPRKPGRPSKKWPRCARYSGKYVCGHCSKGFPQQSQLDQHLRVHTGEKPYPCLDCDARFKQLCHLKQHIRAKHTGERPYKCRFCEKSFVQMCHLQQHERSSNHSSTSQFLLSVAAASQVVVDNSSNYNSSTANTIANTNTNSNNLISNQNQPEATASVNGNTNTFSNQVQSDSNNTPNRLGGVMGSSISLVADPSNPLSVAAAALASSRISPSSPPSSVALSGLQTAPPTLVPPPPSQLQLQTNRLQLQSPVASSAKIRVP